MKYICWDRPSNHKGIATPGCVERIRPAEELRRQGETEDQFLTRMAALLLPPGAPFVLLDDIAHPGRDFRDAWKLQGQAIAHDLPKAKELAKAERAKKGKGKKDAEIDAAQTVAELRAIVDGA